MPRQMPDVENPSTSSSLILCFVLTLITSGCCEKATFTIAQEPRFSVCTGTNPATGVSTDPQARDKQSAAVLATTVTRAHDECQNRRQDLISGVDVVFRYDKLDAADPNDRIFQAVRVMVDEGVNVQGCGDRHIITQPDAIEFFKVPAYDTIAHFRCCEGTMRVEETGSVAVIDITDLPDDIRATLQRLGNPTAMEAVRVELTLTSDQKRRLLSEIEDCAKIKWRQKYEYDGCNRPNFATSCGRQNCLDLEWTDSNGSGRRHFEQ